MRPGEQSAQAGPVSNPCLDFTVADANVVGCWSGADDLKRRELRSRRPVA